MRPIPWQRAMVSLPLAVSLLLSSASTSAATPAPPPVRVVLDGFPLNLDPAPTIIDGRTLVPMRGLLEAMGATVSWDEATRTVTAVKGERNARLKLDRRFACVSADCGAAAVLDAPARLIGDRTYVPARFVSQAMGAHVSWDEATRTVLVNTARSPELLPSAVSIPTLTAGQTIKGPVTLQTAGAEGSYVLYYLIDPARGAGPLIAAGPDVKAAYTYTPDPTVKGPRQVVAAVRDAAGVTRYSDPVPVVLAPEPVVEVTGIDRGGVVEGPIEIGNQLSFVATHAKLFVSDPATGALDEIGIMGPGDKLTWYPLVGHNGDKAFVVAAYDRYGNTYESAPLPIRVQSGYRTVLSGLTDGAMVKENITLRVGGNYPIDGIKYILDDKVLGWGLSQSIKVGPELNGAHTLTVETIDKAGTVRTVGPYRFTVQFTPRLWLAGVGPKQVVTERVTLSAGSNVAVSNAEYWLSDSLGRVELLGRGASLAWTPTAAQAGDRTLQVKARDSAGNLMVSEPVKFRVFLGTIFKPVAVAPSREAFKETAIRLSVPVYQEIGQARSIQVAQALLESAWGQSVPVDKYTGQVSYNLFGIKGTGPAGSVIHNTWEEYNGVSYRVDDYFRAYNSIEESFKDRATFLMVRPWYAPYRAVMTDPILAAWGLKKSGYATDSQYPFKLINLIKAQDLFKLDELEL